MFCFIWTLVFLYICVSVYYSYSLWSQFVPSLISGEPLSWLCVLLTQPNLWLASLLSGQGTCSMFIFCFSAHSWNHHLFKKPWFLSDTFFKHCVCFFTSIFIFYVSWENCCTGCIPRISLHVLVGLALQHVSNFTVITKSKIF